MSNHSTRRPRRLAVLIGAAVLAAVSACADPPTAAGPAPSGAPLPTVQANPKLAAEVPQAIRDRGHLVFAASGPNVPLVFFKPDNKTLTGYDVELGDAIAATLGLTVEWKNISFDSILPGIQAHRYDIGISDFSIEPERLQSVDFVSYVLTGGGFLIKKGSGHKVGNFDDLCGYRVAVQKGASQIPSLVAAGKKCTGAGKKDVTILQIPDRNSLALTLQSGRSDVVVDDKPQVRYAALQSNGALCVASTYQTDHSIAGIAVGKGNEQLLTALRDAINDLIKSGTYAKIGARWNVGVPVPGFQLTEEYYSTRAEPWGIGRDGTVSESRIFTDPNSIQDGGTKYPQPRIQGCE